MSDLNGTFIQQIRDQNFYIEIFLYNQLEGSKPVGLPQFFVNSFSIQESLKTWITQGWIIINNDFEILERGAPKEGDATGLGNNYQPYIFRTDGRNKISFRLFPINKDNDNKTFPRDKWEICYDFVIYDVEDLPTHSNQKKLKKYYFWDERYQIFSEKNIEYSSVYTATKNTTNVKNDYSDLNDFQKSANPNEILRDIIKTASTTPPIMSSLKNNKTDLKIGFKLDGSIDDPSEFVYNLDEPVDAGWDQGMPDNKLFYTSPANYNAIDDINYVLDFCSASDGSPVFMELGRTTDDKKWKLISLSDIFKNANNNQIERLFIEDSVVYKNDQSQNALNINRAPIDVDDSNSKNFTSPVASRITNYKFIPMVAIDDFRITNKPLHSYDFSTGEFKIGFVKNTAKDVRDQLETYARKGLYSFSKENSNSSAQILLNLNKTKADGIQLTNNHMPQRYFPSNYSQMKMIKDALFLNEAISFEVDGLTLRQPGKFIYIDRLANTGLNAFDDRFLGQWLIIKVNHVFTESKYKNEIIAVKVDSFAKIWGNLEK